MADVVDLTARRPALMVRRDKCPKCSGELDTGWECNDCGFDAQAIALAAEQEPPLSPDREPSQQPTVLD